MDEVTQEQKNLFDLSAAYKTIAGMHEGQIVIQDLVRRFGYSRQSTIDVDPLRMAWKEGGRTVLVHIGRMIDMDTSKIDDTSAPRGEM